MLFLIVGVVMASTGSILLASGVDGVVARGLAATILVVGAVVILFCAIVSAALDAYLEALIYRYAVGLAVPGVDTALLPARRPSN